MAESERQTGSSEDTPPAEARPVAPGEVSKGTSDFAYYLTEEFTQKLIDHMHRAKRRALLGDEDGPP